MTVNGTEHNGIEALDRVNGQVPPDQVDMLMDIYCDWREECAALRDAYERWSSVPTADRPLAFAVYEAALDREEWAARVYADHVSRIKPEASDEPASRSVSTAKSAA